MIQQQAWRVAAPCMLLTAQTAMAWELAPLMEVSESDV